MISVLVPAFNEEANLYAAVKTIIDVGRDLNVVLDVIVIDDGSTDGTAAVVTRLETEFPCVRAVRHAHNCGIGHSFREAMAMAKYDRFSIFAGDNNVEPGLIRSLFMHRDAADLVISYFVNTEERGKFRAVVSMIFSTIYILTFNIHVKYINGNTIFPLRELRGVNVRSRAYSIMAEANTKLLRRALTYCEVPGYMNVGATKSSALRLKNLVEALSTYLRLIYEIRFLHRDFYRAFSRRVRLPQ